MVQLIQQWLAMNRKLKNPVAAQSPRVNVTAGLQYMAESQKVGSTTSEGMDALERQRHASKEHNFPSYMSLYSLQSEILAQIRSPLRICIEGVSFCS